MLNSNLPAGATADSEPQPIELRPAQLAAIPMLGDVYEEVLQLFVSDDTLRPWMTKPFLVGNKAVATDAHCLAAVPEWNGVYEQSEKTKGVYPLTPNCYKEIPLSAFKEAIYKVPLIKGYDEETKETKCDECGGEGEVDFEYSANRRDYYLSGECPVCEGEGVISETSQKPNGKMVPDSSKQIIIGKAIFGISNIQKLLKVAEMLNEQTIVLTLQLSANSVSLFKIGECDIIIMPVMSTDNEAVCANIA